MNQPKVVQEVLADLKRNAPVNVSSIVHHFQIQAVVVKIPENITLQNQAFQTINSGQKLRGLLHLSRVLLIE